MNVEISRNELAGALGALGKLVCRTSPMEVYRSLRIEGKENKIAFQTAGLDEAITFTLPEEGVEDFAVVVNFDEFRTVVRYGRSKSVELVYEDGRFGVDGSLMRKLNVAWQEEPHEEGECEVSDLPENFVGLLATAAPIVNRLEPRPILRGIHLCRDGIVATNGKELVNIPLPLAVANLTIPFPHALLATKCEDGGTLTTWNDREQRFFRIALGNWTWTGKALVGDYPNWRKVIPDAAVLDREVDLHAERAAQLANFLKSVPDNPPNHPVTLGMSDDRGSLDITAGAKHGNFPAAFPENWGDFRVTVNRELLLHLLNQGHLRLAFSTTPGPFIATGGIGQYIAMPIVCPPKPQVQPVQPKEENKMNEMQNNVVTAPFVPSAAPKLEPETPVNPLDDLAAAVDEFKTRLRAMFDESTLLARKVKEVALVQKQKERDFVQARRAIERIRMAI